MPNLQTLEQGRAEFAYAAAESIVKFKWVNDCETSCNVLLFQNYLESKYIKENDRDDDKNRKRGAITRFLSTRQYNELIDQESFEKKFLVSLHKDFKGRAKKMPMMIKTSGLGAASAFAFSKSKDYGWIFIREILEVWLKSKGLLETSDKLHSKVIQMNSTDYRALTIEILAFLNWLRRFAEGLIEGEEDGGH